jgi:hypothetical protein
VLGTDVESVAFVVVVDGSIVLYDCPVWSNLERVVRML